MRYLFIGTPSGALRTLSRPPSFASPSGRLGPLAMQPLTQWLHFTLAPFRAGFADALPSAVLSPPPVASDRSDAAIDPMAALYARALSGSSPPYGIKVKKRYRSLAISLHWYTIRGFADALPSAVLRLPFRSPRTARHAAIDSMAALYARALSGSSPPME